MADPVRWPAARWTKGAAMSAAILVLTGCSGGATTISPSPVAAHERCPPSDATVTSSPDRMTATVLVPRGATGVLVCRYWGEGDIGRRWMLAGERTAAAGRALDDLIVRLDALQARPGEHPAPSCPVFGGRSVVLLFRYRGERDDPVRILRATCPVATNGRLTRLALGLAQGKHWPDEGLL